jgi:hypothetical protein
MVIWLKDREAYIQQPGFRRVRSTSDENPVERNRTTCPLLLWGLR